MDGYTKSKCGIVGNDDVKRRRLQRRVDSFVGQLVARSNLHGPKCMSHYLKRRQKRKSYFSEGPENAAIKSILSSVANRRPRGFKWKE